MTCEEMGADVPLKFVDQHSTRVSAHPSLICDAGAVMIVRGCAEKFGRGKLIQMRSRGVEMHAGAHTPHDRFAM